MTDPTPLPVFTDEELRLDRIARVCHEANRGYQAAWPSPGIPVAPAWDDFPEDQRAGVRRGVMAAMTGATPAELHQSWSDEKLRNGWVYGPVKDSVAKTHPSLVPYDELPPSDRAKDALFRAIVDALR